MKVQKIQLENDSQPHWIVIGDDFLPVEPISEYLFFLKNTGKSIYTIRTYAHHLKVFWAYLHSKRLDWKKMNVDHFSYFIASLDGLIEDNVIHLHPKEPKRSKRTINQMMMAVAGFYLYQSRLGHVSEISFYKWGDYFYSHKAFKPLLHHLSKSNPKRKLVLKLKESKSLPKIIDPAIIKAMIEACKSRRDKLLICLLYESGCRIGQVLGLRHQDIETFNNMITIRPRTDNINGARAKTFDENRIHVTKEVMRLYCDYYMNEYGDIDSDYVFVNIWQGEKGKPITYNTIITLFQRLSKKLNVHVTPHMLRHTHATELIKSGLGMEFVQRRLGHRDIQTTINVYTHLSEKDLKVQYQSYLEKIKE